MEWKIQVSYIAWDIPKSYSIGALFFSVILLWGLSHLGFPSNIVLFACWRWDISVMPHSGGDADFLRWMSRYHFWNFGSHHSSCKCGCRTLSSLYPHLPFDWQLGWSHVNVLQVKIACWGNMCVQIYEIQDLVHFLAWKSVWCIWDPLSLRHPILTMFISVHKEDSMRC
jgi:hypothetical protein